MVDERCVVQHEASQLEDSEVQHHDLVRVEMWGVTRSKAFNAILLLYTAMGCSVAGIGLLEKGSTLVWGNLIDGILQRIRLGSFLFHLSRGLHSSGVTSTRGTRRGWTSFLL